MGGEEIGTTIWIEGASGVPTIIAIAGMAIPSNDCMDNSVLAGTIVNCAPEKMSGSESCWFCAGWFWVCCWC